MSKMFIITCECGEEVFCDEEDETLAWQCIGCGQWYDLFGCRIADPNGAQPPQREYYYEPGEQEDD